MPNPVAANDLQPISGSLQTSRISYGVETAGKNYGQNYNGSNWYSDIPNNGQFYTIISDNYTANYYVSRSNAGGAYVEGGLPAVDEYSAPVFWVTVGTSSLDITTVVNGLPDRIGQTPFNSGSQALNWVASSSNYFAVGPDYYAQIDVDNLRLYLDANQVISYPTTQSTWYDLSGQFNNTILYNGPIFDSKGWLDFDGSDDYGLVYRTPSMSPTVGITQEALVNFDADSGVIIGLQYGAGSDNSYALWRDGANWNGLVKTSGGTQVIQYNQVLTTGRWIHFLHTYSGSTQYLYVNGTQVASSGVSGGDIIYDSNNNVVVIAGDFNSGYNAGLALPLNGKLAKTRIYGKGSSASEILQNYYGGPIVTTDLYSRLDAGNLVSYPKSGTTSYELVPGGAGNGALTNGPSFTTAFGGGWVMDGVDDYLRTSVNSNALTPNNSWTVSIWCSLNSYPNITGSPKEGILFGYALYGGLGIYAISSTTGTVNVYGYFRSDSAVDIFGSYVWTLNTPTMFTLVHEAGVGCKFYVNGQLNYNYPGLTGGNWPGYMSLPFDLFSPQNGVYGGGANTYIYYPITTYSTTVYNDKALTSDEVLQNYNATN
jgi:hypothetical protein